MGKMLLFHNSDKLVEIFPANYSERPLFLWYADRWCHYIGTDTYLYLFLVDLDKDDVHLEVRGGNKDFDTLHRMALHFKGWREGTHPDWCNCGAQEQKAYYDESGIVMTKSEMKPVITLTARSYGSGLNIFKQVEYEIISPLIPFSKRTIKIFEKPYEDYSDAVPIKFTDIPELIDLLPGLKEALPFKELSPNASGKYVYPIF